MTPEEVLALAQSGHPKVITAIMNRSTRVHDISVRVARQDDCLHVLMEGEEIANYALMTAFVQASFNKLRLNPEFMVRVYGRKRGDRSISWSRKFEMAEINKKFSHESRDQVSAHETLEARDVSHVSSALPELHSEVEPSPALSVESADVRGDREIDTSPVYFSGKNAEAEAAEEVMNITEIDTFPMTPSPWDAPSDIHSEDIHAANYDDALVSPSITNDETLRSTTSSMTDPMTNPANSPDSAFESSPALSDEEPQPTELSEVSSDAEDPPSQTMSEMESSAAWSYEEPISEEPMSSEISEIPPPAEVPPSQSIPDVNFSERFDREEKDLPESSPVSSYEEPRSDEFPETQLDEEASPAQPTLETETSPTLSYKEPQSAEISEIQLDTEAPPPEPMAEMDMPEEFDHDEDDLDSIDFQQVVKQPEALVLILFAIMIYIWQLYTTLMQYAAPEGSVSGVELAERLKVNRSTISRRKFQDDFSVWTASLDPDGIAWSYDNGAFVPQIPDFSAQ